MATGYDEIMDLTQEDSNEYNDNLPTEKIYNSSDTETYSLSPRDVRQQSPVAKVKSKGKGKGKRTSVGSLEAEAIKKAKTDKQAAKQQQAEEKAAHKAAIEMNKIYKPGECMKYMNIEIHPALLGVWYMSEVGREAAARGARAAAAPALCDAGLVLWTRTVPQTLAANQGQLALTSSKESCARARYVSAATDVQERVRARALAAHVARVRELAAAELTVVIFGVKDFFKSSGRKTSNSNRKLMTEIDLEMAITDVLVSAQCDTVQVESAAELAQLVMQYTRAIADAPHKLAKRACDEQAEFYMKGDNKNCIGVDKDGNGLSRLWQQMVAVLPHSSLEVARAVCAQYKSPRELQEALQQPDAIHAVADVGVARANVPGARARRLGPEFARKLQVLFTEDRGDVLIE